MKKNYVITVGREYCSGGAATAEKVAKTLGIPYYDKVLLDATIEKLNLSKQVAKEHEERPSRMWGMGATAYPYAWYSGDPSMLLPLGMQIAEAQFRIIREVAEKGPCVIVGRCGNYVLRNREHVLNVFVHAKKEARVARAQKLRNLDEQAAQKLIRKMDKVRAEYYASHTLWKWNDYTHYDLLLDSGTLSMDLSAELIVQAVRMLGGR